MQKAEFLRGAVRPDFARICEKNNKDYQKPLADLNGNRLYMHIQKTTTSAAQKSFPQNIVWHITPPPDDEALDSFRRNPIRLHST